MSSIQELANYSTNTGATHSNIWMPVGSAGNAGSEVLVPVRSNGGIVPSGVTDFQGNTYVLDEGDPVASSGNTVVLYRGAETIALQAPRTDTASGLSSSPTITDASIQSSDLGRLVTGTDIPTNSFVGSPITPGTSFKLVNSSGAGVDPSAAFTNGSIQISDFVSVAFPSPTVGPGALVVELAGMINGTSPIQNSLPPAAVVNGNSFAQIMPAPRFATDVVAAVMGCGQETVSFNGPLWQVFTTANNSYAVALGLLINPTPGVVPTIQWKFTSSTSVAALSVVYAGASDPVGTPTQVENVFIAGEAVPKPLCTFKGGIPS